MATINFTDINPGSVTNNYSIIVEGFIYAATDGVYEFETRSDDGVRLMVDGNLVIDNWVNQSARNRTATVNLVSGWKAIRIEHYEAGGSQRLRVRAGPELFKISFWNFGWRKGYSPPQHRYHHLKIEGQRQAEGRERL